MNQTVLTQEPSEKPSAKAGWKHRLVRRFHRYYANAFGYFWLPCPICGENYGGHEWKNHNVGIATERAGVTKGMCNECAKRFEAKHPPGSQIIVDGETGKSWVWAMTFSSNA